MGRSNALLTRFRNSTALVAISVHLPPAGLETYSRGIDHIYSHIISHNMLWDNLREQGAFQLPVIHHWSAYPNRLPPKIPKVKNGAWQMMSQQFRQSHRPSQGQSCPVFLRHPLWDRLTSPWKNGSHFTSPVCSHFWSYDRYHSTNSPNIEINVFLCCNWVWLLGKGIDVFGPQFLHLPGLIARLFAEPLVGLAPFRHTGEAQTHRSCSSAVGAIAVQELLNQTLQFLWLHHVFPLLGRSQFIVQLRCPAQDSSQK